MSFLIFAICASVLVSVFLKLARGHGINIVQAIVINYITAIGWCLILLKPDFSGVQASLASTSVFIVLLLGVLLPSVFIIMAQAVDSVGIAKSDVAQRLALFLPILASFTIFDESLTLAKSTGITLAFLALICMTYRPDVYRRTGMMKNTVLILASVWAGYGVIDILFKQISKQGGAFANTLFLTFVLAFVILLGYLLIKQVKWHGKSLSSGILLGCLNFANILFYIKAHQAYKDDPTLVFAGMNIGVIAVGAIVGVFLFKEKLNAINVIGLSISILAIWCLFYLS